MDKPRIGKPYVFVRARAGGSPEHTTFLRHSDGSAQFEADGFLHGHEGGPEAWRAALQSLIELGFEELAEAKAKGHVPADWHPGPGMSAQRNAGDLSDEV